jgi:hypothetical protein
VSVVRVLGWAFVAVVAVAAAALIGLLILSSGSPRSKLRRSDTV